MGEVVAMPLKCPLCDGIGRVNGLTGDPHAPIKAYTCSLCLGTGKRPTEEELEARRAHSANPVQSTGEST